MSPKIIPPQLASFIPSTNSNPVALTAIQTAGTDLPAPVRQLENQSNARRRMELAQERANPHASKTPSSLSTVTSAADIGETGADMGASVVAGRTAHDHIAAGQKTVAVGDTAVAFGEGDDRLDPEFAQAPPSASRVKADNSLRALQESLRNCGIAAPEIERIMAPQRRMADELVATSAELDEANSDLKSFRRYLDPTLYTISTANPMVDSHEETLKVLKFMIKERSNMIGDLENQLTTANQKLERLGNALAEHEANSGAAQSLPFGQKAVQELKGEIARLEASLTGHKNSEAELSLQLFIKNSALDKSERELKDRDATVASLSAQRDAAVGKNHAYEAHLAEGAAVAQLEAMQLQKEKQSNTAGASPADAQLPDSGLLIEGLEAPQIQPGSARVSLRTPKLLTAEEEMAEKTTSLAQVNTRLAQAAQVALISQQSQRSLHSQPALRNTHAVHQQAAKAVREAQENIGLLQVAKQKLEQQITFLKSNHRDYFFSRDRLDSRFPAMRPLSSLDQAMPLHAGESMAAAQLARATPNQQSIERSQNLFEVATRFRRDAVRTLDRQDHMALLPRRKHDSDTVFEVVNSLLEIDLGVHLHEVYRNINHGAVPRDHDWVIAQVQRLKTQYWETLSLALEILKSAEQAPA